MFYAVRTQHPGTGTRFVVPREVYALSPIEAACKRFNLLGPRGQRQTSALLVTSWHGPALTFDVERDSETGAFVVVES